MTGFLSKCVMAVAIFLGISSIAQAQWEIIGGDQVTAEGSSNTSITTTTTINGDTVVTPYVVYTADHGFPRVRCFKDGKWGLIGNYVALVKARNTYIFSDSANNLYVSYLDAAHGSRLAIKTFNRQSRQWEPLGNNVANLYLSNGSIMNANSKLWDAHNSWMAFDSNNVPYVVYAETDDGGKPYVKRFINGSWEIVGGGPLNTTDRASGVGIAISRDNTPYVVYCAGDGSTGQVTVYGFKKNTWTSLDVPADWNSSRYTTVTIANNRLYIIFMNANAASKATVISAEIGKGDWAQLGGFLSSNISRYTNITVDEEGNVYAAFIDKVSKDEWLQVVRVKEFPSGGKSWIELIDSTATNGIDAPASNLAIVASAINKPYVVYTKSNSANVTTPIVQYCPTPIPPMTQTSDSIVQIKDFGSSVVVSNGIVSFKVDKSTATILNLYYNGVDMLGNGYRDGRIYYVWVLTRFQTPSNCTYSLVTDPKDNDGQLAELKFHMEWAGASSGDAPMDVDIYFALAKGAHGVYSAEMLTHPTSYPELPSGQISVTGYVSPMFDWLSVDSLRNMELPSHSDMHQSVPVDGAPKEVTRIVSGPFKGKYECKYNYSSNLGELDVWGWSSTTENYGIWMTVPSYEYYNGGPLKNELTVHESGAFLNCLGATHYGMGGDGVVPAGQFWRKIYGPYLIYCNQVPKGTPDAHDSLWHDAIRQAKVEQKKWPYNWYTNPYYVHNKGRGTITGHLEISDSANTSVPAADMWVGAMIPPPSVQGKNDWFELWSKGYQFWTKTDSTGNFTIPNVIASDTSYNLYAFGPAAAGKMSKELFVRVTAGDTINLGTVKWKPARIAPTVWEIGVPDRTAKEFKDGLEWWNPEYYPSTHWGRFFNYFTDFPDGVNYTIDKSDWSKDWYFVQPYYKDSTTSSPIWTVNFKLTKSPKPKSTAAIYVSYAAHYSAATIIKVNGFNISEPETGYISSNSSDAMIRLGSHGAWSQHWFTFPSKLLHAGDNKVTFEERLTGGASHGSTMYDYIRLEAWGTKVTTKDLQTITFDSIAHKYPDDPDFILHASASSGLPVSYASSNPSVATISNGEVNIIGEGSTIITASQAGDSLWLPAPDVERTLVVAKQRNAQTITFDPIPDEYLGKHDFKLNVSTNSGLPLTFTSNNPTVATIIEGKLHLVSVGPVTITVSQSGNDTWLPAEDVSRSFNVKVLVKPEYNKLLSPNGDGINDKLVIKHIAAYPQNRIQIFDEEGQLIYQKSNYNNDWDGEINGRKLANGTYYFVFTSDNKVKIKGTVSVIN